MVKLAGVLSGLVVAGWIYLMGDVQHNFIEDPAPRIAYEVGTFYAVAVLVLIWLTVLIARLGSTRRRTERRGAVAPPARS